MLRVVARAQIHVCGRDHAFVHIHKEGLVSLAEEWLVLLTSSYMIHKKELVL